MADEVFKQKRRIESEEIETGDPFNRIQEVQSAMAQEKGEEFDTFKNPDSPIQMSGNIPPGLKEMMQQRGGGQAAPAPAKRKMESKEASKVASDAYDALMEKLVSHSTWEAVELPSRGKFYDSIPGVLHLRPMTGNEEQILATPRHVRRGKAIDMIFEKCIRENIQPSELLSIDRDYLLIFLRGISYTPEYDVEVRCPECAQKFNTIVDVAVVEVALKNPKVGVEVAVMFPDASVESNELIATDERVSDGVVIDDVAVNVDAKTFPPVNTPLPTTESVLYGEVVPIPMLPFVDILILSKALV
jgi:hypothetical protein